MKKFKSSNLANKQITLDIYKIYIERHLKEGDWLWTRFNIYLSLSIGILALAGYILKDFLSVMPFDGPIWLWAVLFFIFLVGANISHTWQKICIDGARWQLLIDRHIALLESKLFEKINEGLYTEILSVYHKSKDNEKDSADTNIMLSKFFFFLWLICSLISLAFFVITVLRKFGFIVF